MSEYGTPYQETEAVLAAQAGDDETLRAILADMTKYELATLQLTVRKLSDRLRQEWQPR